MQCLSLLSKALCSAIYSNNFNVYFIWMFYLECGCIEMLGIEFNKQLISIFFAIWNLFVLSDIKVLFVYWSNEFLQFLYQKFLDVIIDVTKITFTSHNLQNLNKRKELFCRYMNVFVHVVMKVLSGDKIVHSRCRWATGERTGDKPRPVVPRGTKTSGAGPQVIPC